MLKLDREFILERACFYIVSYYEQPLEELKYLIKRYNIKINYKNYKPNQYYHLINFLLPRTDINFKEKKECTEFIIDNLGFNVRDRWFQIISTISYDITITQNLINKYGLLISKDIFYSLLIRNCLTTVPIKYTGTAIQFLNIIISRKYDKVCFIDADIKYLKKMDHYYIYINRIENCINKYKKVFRKRKILF